MNRKDIAFFRGDTFIATLKFKGYEPSALDSIKYALKKSTRLGEKTIAEHTITCPNEKYELRFEHDDTKDLDEGVYYYDVQLLVEGNIYKTILFGSVKLKGDVTN